MKRKVKSNPGDRLPRQPARMAMLRWELDKDRRRKVALAHLRAVIPEKEVALRGWPVILDFVGGTLGLRMRSGHPPSRRAIKRWHYDLDFPLLRGAGSIPGRRKSVPPFTTSFLVVTWAISQYESGASFRVAPAEQDRAA
jgi:hypothetical protein